VLNSLCIRLKESEIKKKKSFTVKSSSYKEQQKYYEMILRKLQEYISSKIPASD